MRRKLLTLVVLAASLALTQTTFADDLTHNKARTARTMGAVPSELNTVKACPLKGALPSVFFTGMECEPCCNASEQTFIDCLTYTNKTQCECVAMAYDSCLDHGCGPCICCSDWVIRGKNLGCINETTR
jgi:hypothetical protein